MSIDVPGVISSFGSRGALVPLSRIEDIKQDMMALKNGPFHTDWLDKMVRHVTDASNPFLPSGISFDPCSLISVVTPSPKVTLQFVFQGEEFDCAVPPHYTNWDLNNESMLQDLKDYLAPHGYSVAMAKTFPQKMLAVHAGLGFYGRNNVYYHEEFGSYVQLMTYVTDLPSKAGTWHPLRRMDQCSNCYVCVRACPTKAIDSSRRLIDSDRCLTYYDEIPGEFPEWIDKKAHNCIIGCIKCQDCCSSNFENKRNAQRGVAFTEEETNELLHWKENEPCSSTLAEKLAMTGIPEEYTNMFPRNLAVLLEKRKV